MTISTVVICRNAAPYIEACIQSIRQQTQSSSEIIVVDGNSEDGTVAWLLGQQDIVLIRQTGTGIANARNQGISAAKGLFIAFLDADDVWKPEKLAGQLLFLQQQEAVQAVTGHLTKSDDPEANLWAAMTPGGFLFRREVFQQFGLFSEEWVVASDHEWLIRAIRQGMKYETVPETVLVKGMHEGNLSKLQKKRYRAEMMDIMRR